MRDYTIYHIVGHDNRVRYVGVSINPVWRLTTHFNSARARLRGNQPLCASGRWMLSEAIAGRKPSVVPIRPAGRDWKSAERSEIKGRLALGDDLLNHMHGLGGNSKCPVCNTQEVGGRCAKCEDSLRLAMHLYQPKRGAPSRLPRKVDRE